jgi:N6-L-threonylcarbamoyladenine synthase
VLVLGIDTSCDDTGVGIVRGRRLLANVVASQAAIHGPFGGVLPELASRAHLDVIDAVVEEALIEAGIELSALDAVAATYGPGLNGALLMGLSYAKGLAWALGVPFVAVHHLEGHLAAALPEGGPTTPYLALLASGGHTLLVDVPEAGRYLQLGRSLDDAAGEAFDKVARLLGLGFPGGAALAALADQGDPDAFELPIPLAGRSGFDFSFSGLKTAVAVRLERDPGAPKADVAAAFQRRAIDHLVDVSLRAAKDLGRNRLVVAGGVAANERLQQRLAAAKIEVHLPPAGLATDNGAMIALAAVARLEETGGAIDDLGCDATPYLPLGAQSSRPRDATRGTS